MNTRLGILTLAVLLVASSASPFVVQAEPVWSVQQSVQAGRIDEVVAKSDALGERVTVLVRLPRN